MQHDNATCLLRPLNVYQMLNTQPPAWIPGMLRQSREAAAAGESPEAQPGNVLSEVACRLGRGILAAHILKEGPHGALMGQVLAPMVLIP